MSSHSRQAAGADQLARTRERFLTRDAVEPQQVREPILASWSRSREWNVPADHIELSYVRDPDLDTPLTRSAMPVLRHLRDHLEGQPISVILTDAAGVVLSRLTSDPDLERHLDGVNLAPGFSYAEEQVGTNGIGTALEGGQPAHVFGHEHYAEHLEDLACAGVPIHHPISGKVVGAVDLTCWRKHADQLLIALVMTTADQITQALLTDSSARELELLQDYLRACHRSNGIVLALSKDLVMMNEHAQQVLDPADQAVLLSQAGDAMAVGKSRAVEVELPTGLTARMHCHPTRGPGPLGSAGGVVHVKLLEVGLRMSAETPTATRMALPGLVGSGALWLRSCQQVQEAYEADEWLVLEGEAGVGKLALARAVHQRRSPAGRFDVLDAADAGAADWMPGVRRALLAAEGDLVIRHVDKLAPRQTHLLAGALAEARSADREDRLWVAVTLTRRTSAPTLTELLRMFPGSVTLPPLRHHIEDLPELTTFFLGKLSQHGRLAVSPEAAMLLARSNWPGNVEQLWQVFRRIVQHRRAGSILARDLPPECWTVSRRLLSPLESLERDAIVQSLHDTEGNKARAAESLGMSRATIYRKIHEYGIIIPVG
ncbi:MAG TPA: GAF domain-containing protein [Streptosporangiaceae bacterium]|nr:GAF domain-containing protein [Streptosporangiaceae bacterium]